MKASNTSNTSNTTNSSSNVPAPSSMVSPRTSSGGNGAGSPKRVSTAMASNSRTTSSKQKSHYNASSRDLTGTSNSNTSEFPSIRAVSRAKSPAKSATGGNSKKKRAANSSTSTDSTDHVELPKVASITYTSDRHASFETGEELEILKAILVREGYLQRLTQNSEQGKVSGSSLSETIDLLDLLRIATLEVVESILNWRKKKHSHDPYKWNEMNYLLKMSADLDFLQKHTGLIQWLGFTLVRNPFIVPMNLDCRLQMGDWQAYLPNGMLPAGATAAAITGGHKGEDDSSTFIQIGGKHRSLESYIGERVNTAGQAIANSIQAAFLAEKKRPKNPYETRVLNDEELVPLQKAQTQWQQQQQFQNLQNAEKAAARPKSRAHRSDSSGLVIPSQIGELEMSRIREAEALLLMEEEVYGRYTHDTQGRIIPEEEALKKTRMLEMSGGAYRSVFALEKDKEFKRAAANAMLIEPFAPASTGLTSSMVSMTTTSTQEELDQNQEEGQDLTLSNSFGASVVARATDDAISGSSSLPGKLHAKKRAGMLGPITKSRTTTNSNKLVPPPRRSRGAHLEQVLAQEKEANGRFGLLIERLREEIEQKEMEVAYFESYAELQVSFKEELGSFRSKARHEIQLLRQDLAQKLYVFESKRQNILNKEEIIHTFKKQFKTSTEAVRAAQLNARKDQAAAVAASLALSNSFLSVDSTQDQSTTKEEIEEAKKNTIERLQLTSEQVTKAVNNQIEHEQTAPIIYHVCATSIQRIARGMIARKNYANMRIEFTVSSKYIQAVVRGFLARRKVAKLYWRKVATIILQRYARGMLSRLLVRRKKRDLMILSSTLLLQRVVRGHLGRVRMKKIHFLVNARRRMTCGVQSLTFDDLKELADACDDMVASANSSTSTKKPQWMPSLVLGLVRLVILFLSEDDASEPDITCVRWKEAAIYLRRSHRLLRLLTRLAAASEGHYLRPSWWGSSLLTAYQADKDFDLKTFQQLKKGSRGAVALFHWVENFALITRYQTVLKPLNLSFQGYFLARHASEKQHEQDADRTEELENKTLEEDLEKRFVPLDLVQAYHTRPRPVVLVLSLDLPLDSKQRLIDSVFIMFPGLFLLLSHEKYDKEYNGMDFTAIQNAISVGYSVIIECDIGLSDPNQRRFVGALSSIQAALQPKPLCILLKSSNRNRNPVVGLSLVPSEINQIIQEQHPQGDSAGSSDSNNSITRATAVQIPTAASAAVAAAIATTMSLVDGTVKQSFEAAAELLYLMSDKPMQDEMERLSTEEAPVNPLVLVMEAVIVLLTPTKRYEGPKSNTSAITWRLGKRLLSNALFFLTKLHQVTYESITKGNLLALDKYLLHADWPSGTVRHAQSSNVMFLLASWVESIVKGVHLLEDCGGIAPEITRMTPVQGLFGNIVTFSNVYEEEVNDDASQLAKKHAQAVSHGEDKAFLELSLAVLGDVRVFRKARKLLEDPLAMAYPLSSSNALLNGASSTNPSGLCVVNVFHDCQRIYFSAYDPSISRVFTSIVSEQQVHVLLAPNSIENGRNTRTPPTTRAEMYERLANLCLLQRKPVPIALNKSSSSKLLTTPTMVKSIAKTGAVPDLGELELVVRPRTIRLYRKAIKMCGFLATLTMSELSRGRIQVDAFVHNLRGKNLQLIVNLENILERMSAYEVRETSSYRPAELIPKLVLDRLHLFRTSPASIHSSIALTTAGSSSATSLQELKLAIRKRETSTGRLLLRRAIKSRWFIRTDRSVNRRARPRMWLLSIYESHTENCYRIEFYQPHCCEKHQLRISKRDFQDYFLPVLGANNAHRTSFRTCVTSITADNTPRQPQVQQKIQQQLQKSTLCRSFVLDGEEEQASFLQKWIHRLFRLELVRDEDDHQNEEEYDDENDDHDHDDREEGRPMNPKKTISPLTIPAPVKEKELMIEFEKEEDLEIQHVVIRRVLARFPFALPFLPHPHLNEQIKRKKQLYVQVESLVLPGDGNFHTGGLVYRFMTPASCEEQILELKDAEIDSCWESQYNWFLASLAWKMEMTKSLVTSCFYYDPNKQLVMARLPCGDFYARLSEKTKTFQEKERQRQLPPPVPVVVSKPVEKPSGIIFPTINLLDLELYQTQKIQAAKVSTPYTKPCYLYDQEELLVKKSFRSNGVLLMVKVFLKAVIVDRFIQANPKDRVKQEDSFEIRFECYHPPTSSGTNILIKGMKDLREVVGPDKIALIRSKSIKEMLQHIIENRMEVQLPGPAASASVPEASSQTNKKSTKASSSSSYLSNDHHLGIVFMRDRLYEKQKATPINQLAVEDQRSNATKLIDRMEERGIKILTKTRLIHGIRVILTVFDVSSVEDEKSSLQDPEVILRVDGYIGETSAKSSLVLQTVDLLLVAGEQRDMLFDKTRRKEFAISLVDRIGLEELQRLETTTEIKPFNHYRLFVTDYYTPSVKEGEKPSKNIKKDPTKTLLFKSVRLVSSERILVSTYWVELEDEEGHEKSYVVVEFYEPLSCTKCLLSIEKSSLDLIFGVEDLIHKRRSNSQTFGLENLPMSLLMTHLSSFVRVEKKPRLEDGSFELVASLALDFQKAHEMRQHFLKYGDPSLSNTAEPIKMETIERVRSTEVVCFDGIVGNGQFFAVSFGLSTFQQEKRALSHELVCCVYSPSSYLMNTVAIDGVDLKLKYGWELSSTQECYALLQKELMQHLRVEVEEIGTSNMSSSIHLQIRLD